MQWIACLLVELTPIPHGSRCHLRRLGRTPWAEDSHDLPIGSRGASKYILHREFSMLSNTILYDAYISRNFALLPGMSDQESSCYRFPACTT